MKKSDTEQKKSAKEDSPQMDDLQLEDADEAILSSLQDIAANLDEYDEENDIEEEEDDADAIEVSMDGLEEEADETPSSAVTSDEALKAANVHVIKEHEIATKDKELNFLRDELRRLTKENDGLQNQFVRIKADYENLKKRSRREMDERLEKKQQQFLHEFLPVIDNLERGLERTETIPDDMRSFIQGFSLTLNLFQKALRSFKVTPIESLGAPFDPLYHEAVSTVVTEDHPHNSVMVEHAKGYMHDGRVLRPAVVVVAKNPGGAPVPEAPPAAEAADTPDVSPEAVEEGATPETTPAPDTPAEQAVAEAAEAQPEATSKPEKAESTDEIAPETGQASEPDAPEESPAPEEDK